MFCAFIDSLGREPLVRDNQRSDVKIPINQMPYCKNHEKKKKIKETKRKETKKKEKEKEKEFFSIHINS